MYHSLWDVRCSVYQQRLQLLAAFVPSGIEVCGGRQVCGCFAGASQFGASVCIVCSAALVRVI